MTPAGRPAAPLWAEEAPRMRPWSMDDADALAVPWRARDGLRQFVSQESDR